MPFGPQYPFNRFGRRQPSLHPEQGSWFFGRRQGRKPQEGKRSRKIAGRKRIARHRIVHHSTRKIPQTSQKSHWRYGLFRNLRQGILRSMSAKRRKRSLCKSRRRQNHLLHGKRLNLRRAEFAMANDRYRKSLAQRIHGDSSSIRFETN